MSVFHSVSAFCNAGLDLLGSRGAFSSLMSYAYEPLINLSVMLLIITWSLALCLVPAVFFFLLDFQGLPAGKRAVVALFQLVTTRTAGFDTAVLIACAATIFSRKDSPEMFKRRIAPDIVATDAVLI